jgi:hypothetical protein
MPEAVSPAAPAAPAPAAQTSAPPPAARTNNGQFSPKDGAQSKPVVEQKPAAAAPPPEKKPEPYRFKRKIDNEDVDLDEGGLEQALKELRYRRSRQQEVDTGKKEIAELLKLAATDDEAFLRKVGLDPDAIAARRLERAQRLAQMTPEQRQLEEDRMALEAERKGVLTEKEKLAKQAREATRARVQQQNREEYEAALGHSALPHSRAKLFLMTQLQRGRQESGAPKFTPDQLGKAYDDMMLSAFSEMVGAATTKPEVLARFADLPKLGIAHLDKLDGAELLAALGPGLKRKVLQASVAEHRGQQTIPVRNGAPPPAPARQSTGTFDEVELEQRKRDLLKSFG